ncbi:hypothetical protein SAMN05216246_1132 [Actinomyces denticolens]|uniref:Uncharacterized protein n=1 Tax=Actinomyces denticolens TaxID=52767 RepID=A0ABY1IGU1_9ACTO|nr:hypothetical protein SAMN05216246_1132 [Actinomyces denticolens]
MRTPHTHAPPPFTGGAGGEGFSPRLSFSCPRGHHPAPPHRAGTPPPPPGARAPARAGAHKEGGWRRRAPGPAPPNHADDTAPPGAPHPHPLTVHPDPLGDTAPPPTNRPTPDKPPHTRRTAPHPTNRPTPDKPSHPGAAPPNRTDETAYAGPDGIRGMRPHVRDETAYAGRDGIPAPGPRPRGGMHRTKAACAGPRPDPGPDPAPHRITSHGKHQPTSGPTPAPRQPTRTDSGLQGSLHGGGSVREYTMLATRTDSGLQGSLHGRAPGSRRAPWAARAFKLPRGPCTGGPGPPRGSPDQIQLWNHMCQYQKS